MRQIPQVIMLSLAVGTFGCATKQATSSAPNAAATTPTVKPTDSTVLASREAVMPSIPGMVALYFDFDSFTLTAQSRAQLDDLAEFLRTDRTATANISGHADDRGTVEYNLALGQHRANVAREYLIRLGIAGTRLHAISYGEAHPVAVGQDESTWAQNRRDEVTLKSAAVAGLD